MYVMPDPEKAMVDYLTTAMAARSETYKATSVSPSFPTSAVTYHVQVELETGRTDDYPVTERSQVRFTCWTPAGKRSDALALASLTQALVEAHPGSSDVAGVRSLGGRSAATKDPDTGRYMCWFLARVNLKAQALA